MCFCYLSFSHKYELLDFDIKLTNVYVIKNLSYDEAELYIKNKIKIILCIRFMEFYD